MAYSLTYGYNSTNQTYVVSGWADITTNDKVVIPPVYDDGTNGEHPVTSIGSSAFSKCETLVNIALSDTITYIGNSAFINCSGLKNIDIPDSVVNIESGAFAYCTSLTNISMPNSVTTIGSSLFAYDGKLENISLSKNLRSINSNMFHACSKLATIIIPDSVTAIETLAFSECSALKEIVLLPVTPPTLDASAIPSTIENIYVEDDSIDAYKQAQTWSTFGDKIQSNNLIISFARYSSRVENYVNNSSTNISTREIDKYINNLQVTIDNVPNSATQGTLLQYQLDKLLQDNNCYIMFNNEKYYLEDKNHTNGYITYSHVGYENYTHNLKTITINTSTRFWTLSKQIMVNNVEYVHYITIKDASDNLYMFSFNSDWPNYDDMQFLINQMESSGISCPSGEESPLQYSDNHFIGLYSNSDKYYAISTRYGEIMLLAKDNTVHTDTPNNFTLISDVSIETGRSLTTSS